MIIAPPPSNRFRRPRTWRTFETLFDPIADADGNLMWSYSDLQLSGYGLNNWWTVVDSDTGRLIVAAGLHYVNRVGYMITRNAWAEPWHQHPDYFYD